jgi:hypothetical protein
MCWLDSIIEEKIMKRISNGLWLVLLVIVLVFAISVSQNNTEKSDETTMIQESTSVDKTEVESEEDVVEEVEYSFRTGELYESHFQKHRDEFGNISKETYLIMANDLIDLQSVLTKYEDDGDILYYDEATNEFLVLSSDGYIRTFFKPDNGINYYNRQ